MPTYEYACRACRHEFELEQSIKDKPAKKCPKCGKLKANRQISQGNFILKGSGWYADLYSGPSNEKKAAAKAKDKDKDKGKDKASAKEASGSADKKSDTSDKKPKGKPKVDAA